MASSQTRVQGVDAIYYSVEDLDRAMKFYTDLLGMEPSVTFANFGAEWTLPHGESFGIMKLPDRLKETHGRYWRGSSGVMFAVKDLDAEVAAAKARGVKFHDEGKPQETPVCFMVFGEDSEGNTFALHKRK
ncbi:MAG TPA: VOC family protein [Candidatus Binatus sp.]|nr:VOC family protein [Candidatus Binatus sp.]